MSISTTKGVYLLDLNPSTHHEKLIVANSNTRNTNLRLIVDYSFGPTSVVDCISSSQNFLVLKSNGHLQVWNDSQQKILQSIDLGLEVKLKKIL